LSLLIELLFANYTCCQCLLCLSCNYQFISNQNYSQCIHRLFCCSSYRAHEYSLWITKSGVQNNSRPEVLVMNTNDSN